MTRRFELRFESTEALLREVDSNLRRGRTFVPGEIAPADRSPCIVGLRHPDTGVVVELSGEIVFCQGEGPYLGVGIDLVDSDLADRIEQLYAPPDRREDALPAEQVQRGIPLEIDLGFADGAAGDDEGALRRGDEEAIDVELAEEPSRSLSQPPDSRRGITIHERVRKLSAPARDRLARSGNLAERVALERAFGGSVWEALLENSQITGAEIARIAKNGLAPAPILSHIAGHGGWLAKPEVRRALLANSRLPAAQVERVLRALPPAELRLVPSQAGYPAGVRAQARRMLQR